MSENIAINENLIQDAELDQLEADLVEQLSTLSSKDLKQKVKQHNEFMGLSQGMAGYVAVSATKDEMIDALIASEVSNTVHDKPVAGVESFTTKVSLSQVEVSPFNFRNPIDYEDTQLEKSIQASGGLLKAPIVRATDRTDGQGRTIYEIVGGNRSTEALRRVIAGRGESLEDQIITVIVRNYTGSELQQYMQESLEMIMDNESQRPASPQDRLSIYQHLIELGLTQTAIAEKLGVSVPYIHKTLRLAILPERIMDLVHFEFNKDVIAREDTETLDKFKVPYTVTEDGEVVVHGVSLSNAGVMMDLFPKAPALTSENYVHSKARYDAEVRRVTKFLESQVVIDAACHNLKPEFTKRLKEFAISAGIIKEDVVQAVETKAPMVELVADVSESSIVQADEATVSAPKEPSKSVKVSESAVEQAGEVEEPVQQALSASSDFFTYEDESEESADDGEGLIVRNAYEAGQDILSGELHLSDKWIAIFSDSLKMGDSKAYAAYKYLFKIGVIVENLDK